ncbi:MAG: oxidoreductase [Firmicutes bacterium]|jgi:coenzyme F420-reducing hydrogenase gamma subunit|nr:oxidoreductase [Bacillota bacterium]
MGKAKLAVWKFASCDGCQLSILDCEDELLAIADAVEIANFTEMTRKVIDGPYDISLVEGSITTADDAQRIVEIRKNSAVIVAIGACATAGGIQALRNYADIDEYVSAVYAHPEYISTLATSRSISDFIKVDLELHGCPVNKEHLIELVAASLAGRKPRIPQYSVCEECKLRGNVCVVVAENMPCLGPVTSAGCGALCPAVKRGCYGCFGPMQKANTTSLAIRLKENGADEDKLHRMFKTFNATKFEKEFSS